MKGDINATIASLAELLKPKPSTSPKLEVKPFHGKIEDWQEFWDRFESSIHSNTTLSSANKFSYLCSHLGGAAETAVSGLTLMSVNYQATIHLLKERFGKPPVIERAHVNGLLNVRPVYHDIDTAGLRRLYDTVEMHHGGLKALNVNAEKIIMNGRWRS